MASKDTFAKSSKKRFEVAEASEVELGVGGTFKAEEVGVLGGSPGSGLEIP